MAKGKMEGFNTPSVRVLKDMKSPTGDKIQDLDIIRFFFYQMQILFFSV